MSVLLLDAGNTRVKWKKTTSAPTFGRCEYAALQSLDWDSLLDGVEQILVACVGNQEFLREQLQQQVAVRHNCVLHWIDQPLHDLSGFEHCYPHPERLGVDRWLAMLGARQHRQGDLLVIDAGTALTIDFLSTGNHHDGGFIVPGLAMTRQALWQNTRRVIPWQDEQDDGRLLPGRDTLQCVSAGARRQQVAFVRSIMDDYPGHSPFITGGDGDWLAATLGQTYWPELVLDGLETLCAGYFSRC